jgi:TonB family protein
VAPAAARAPAPAAPIRRRSATDYPPDARRLGIEGQVKVRLKVDAEGNVASRSLVTRLGHGLDELALRLAARLRFKPAIDTSDKPVPATVVWTFTFTLPR